ncbi:MAG: type II toxin-antitoxin system RelE/ParE family toxin [Allosphingosinicella sp.]
MKSVLTEAAISDLAGIARSIAKDDMPTARRFTAELRKRALAIGRSPRLYPYAEGLEDLGIRRRLHKGYLIFFRETGCSVEILHFVHGARDWLALFVNSSPR